MTKRFRDDRNGGRFWVREGRHTVEHDKVDRCWAISLLRGRAAGTQVYGRRQQSYMVDSRQAVVARWSCSKLTGSRTALRMSGLSLRHLRFRLPPCKLR